MTCKSVYSDHFGVKNSLPRVNAGKVDRESKKVETLFRK